MKVGETKFSLIGHGQTNDTTLVAMPARILYITTHSLTHEAIDEEIPYTKTWDVHSVATTHL